MDYIKIYRQDYRDAKQIAASEPVQENGYEPNVISEALTGTAMTAGTEYAIAADFKDHKTVFVVEGAGNLTFKGGDTYRGVKDLIVATPAGTSMIWLDSADYINSETGEIIVEADASISMFGYEMR